MSFPAPLIVDEVFAFLLVFCRLGAVMMLLPGFGEAYVNARSRLMLALATSLLVVSVVGPSIPPMPAGVGKLAVYIVSEIVLGLFIGAVIRLVMGAIHFGGSVIAMQSGLAAAMFFDPSESTQGTITGNILALTFLLLLFTTDTHHWLLQQITQSYGRLPAAGTLPLADMLELVVRLGAEAISVGVAIAAPILVLGFIVNLALGLVSRLVPSLQVLMVALPMQLLMTLAVFGLVAAAGFTAALEFLDRASGWLVTG